MQTILGANGVIAKNLARTLFEMNKPVRLVSRHPQKVHPTDELFTADLLDADQTSQSVRNSDVVYLTAGLKYDIKVWQAQWPVIMRNVIDACKREGARLVFFDNVYAYGKVDGWMTEETPVNPCSKKGEVRAKIAQMLLDEMGKENFQAIIARAADFYGPDTPLSFVQVMVFDNLRKGKKAQWMIDDSLYHSFTYTPDAGRATAILGNTESAYNQIWHLPTDRNVLTGKEFIKLAAQAFDQEPRYMVLPKWMLRIGGWFTPVIRESMEMLYQNEFHYRFDSTKFENAFGFRPAPYEKGIAETAGKS